MGLFGHDVPDDVLGADRRRDALELARLVSLRLGATMPQGSLGPREAERPARSDCARSPVARSTEDRRGDPEWLTSSLEKCIGTKDTRVR